MPKPKHEMPVYLHITTAKTTIYEPLEVYVGISGYEKINVERGLSHLFHGYFYLSEIEATFQIASAEIVNSPLKPKTRKDKNYFVKLKTFENLLK